MTANKVCYRYVGWFVGFLASIFISYSAMAHHSGASYDWDKEEWIEGKVVKFKWRNPHITFEVEALSASGQTELRRIEWVSVPEAMAAGFTKDSIVPGMSIKVLVHPSKRTLGRASGIKIITEDGDMLSLHGSERSDVAPTTSNSAKDIFAKWVPVSADFHAAAEAPLDWSYVNITREELEEFQSKQANNIGVCADYPTPLLSIFPDLRTLELQGDTVVMRFEAQGQNIKRTVHLGMKEHPKNIAPTLVGHSIGWWEGKTLVVDTVSFSPHPMGVYSGVPSGPDKHTVERFSLAEGGRYLQYDFQIEDSKLAEPGTINMRWEYRPDLDFSGVECDPDVARELLHE